MAHRNFLRSLLSLTLLAYVGSAATAWASTPAKKPNILYILADDLGYADLSVQGQKKFQTPNIDSIFEQGVRFTNGHVSNSVCAPSRAGLITGRLGSYFGFEANLPHKSYAPHSTIGLDPEQKTIADVLKPAGYKSFCIGKWHLGYNVELFHPNRRGFDEFVGLLGGSRSYFKIDYNRGNSLQHNGEYLEEPDDMYITDFLTDKAIGLIRDHHAESPEQPFFMYMSYTAPHHPMDAKESDLARVTNITKEPRRTYVAMVLSMDDNIGRLQACLEELGIADNTMVVFMSDNGGPIGKNGSWNGQLRGGKGSLFEGGVRVPFGMKWPGVIPAGQVNNAFVSSVDLMPTFAAISGADQLQPIVSDGMDLIPMLTGKVKDYPNRLFFWRRGNMTNVAARYRNYKYIHNRRNETEYLFDLHKDPYEKNNLINAEPKYAEVLRKIQAKWEATLPDPSFSSDWKSKRK